MMRMMTSMSPIDMILSPVTAPNQTFVASSHSDLKPPVRHFPNERAISETSKPVGAARAAPPTGSLRCARNGRVNLIGGQGRIVKRGTLGLAERSLKSHVGFRRISTGGQNLPMKGRAYWNWG